MKLSCGFATSLDSPEHVRIAEELGYERAWLYDSPPILADVWTQLTRAADRTERIGLGAGVLIPNLRHPMTTASAIATLVGVAGRGRVVVGIGTGFTARIAMGHKPLTWASVAEYMRTVKALLRGEETLWEERLISMMAWPGFLPDRPIEVPWIVAAMGPKGEATAREYADGVFVADAPLPGFDWSVMLQAGTVVRDGEDPNSPRVLAAAGHAAAVMYHFGYVGGNLENMPRGKEYAALYDDVAPERVHLEMHYGHLCGLNQRDATFIDGDLLVAFGMARSRQGWRERFAQLAEGGITELVYSPAGPDIPGELEDFAAAFRGV
ncbi:MAG TPA: LLM class flavin-dependent oxidoreductase [Sporichthyaceae bacterium]|nr:LLM class flavin-dependent oxidoreductase [Sporichthyaceae bacterium]